MPKNNTVNNVHRVSLNFMIEKALDACASPLVGKLLAKHHDLGSPLGNKRPSCRSRTRELCGSICPLGLKVSLYSLLQTVSNAFVCFAIALGSSALAPFGALFEGTARSLC